MEFLSVWKALHFTQDREKKKSSRTKKEKNWGFDTLKSSRGKTSADKVEE